MFFCIIAQQPHLSDLSLVGLTSPPLAHHSLVAMEICQAVGQLRVSPLFEALQLCLLASLMLLGQHTPVVHSNTLLVFLH